MRMFKNVIHLSGWIQKELECDEKSAETIINNLDHKRNIQSLDCGSLLLKNFDE